MAFKRAERKQAKLRLALAGPSGSGKTYSALLIASGLGGRIALIDTEAGSGELYADLLEYDYDRLDPPFDPKRYIKAIQSAEQAGYSVLILDSLSHAWSGTGGILDIKDNVSRASRSGNSFDAWRSVTPEHNALVDAILRSPMHIIATLRTKTAYEIVEDERGKKKPVKIGLKPEQREGMEYEFTVVLDLSVEGHTASSSKDRTGLFDARPAVPSVEMGRALLGWLTSGAAEPVAETPEQVAARCYARLDSLTSLPAVNAWVEKHRAEIEALPKPLRQGVAATIQARREQVGPYVPVGQRDGAPTGERQ